MSKILVPFVGAGIVVAAFATMPEVWAQGGSIPGAENVELPAALTKVPFVGDFLLSVQKWLPVLFQVIGTFSMIAALTANETDDKVVNWILRVINALGFNFGTAKNDPTVGVNKSQ